MGEPCAIHVPPYPQALVAFEHAMELNPRHTDAIYGIGIVADEQGRHDEALVRALTSHAQNMATNHGQNLTTTGKDMAKPWVTHVV